MASLEIIKWKNKSPPAIEDIEEMFSKRSLSNYSFSNSARDFYSAHSHSYNKFLVITKGKMRWRIDSKAHELSAGDSIVLPRGMQHEVECLTDCRCREGHF